MSQHPRPPDSKIKKGLTLGSKHGYGMIEEELISLYKKTRKQLAALLEDMTFANFYRALQAGNRSYLLKNTLITKGIDEDWVNAIKDAIPHLDHIVNNPRKYMKRETDVVPIEKAKIVNQESVQHLASHTNFINSIDNGVVKPNKILTTYNEESLELYENRFVATLIIRVSQFIDRRYFLLGAGGREFSSTVTANGSFEQAGEETDYSLSMTVKQGADYFDGGVTSKIYEDLFLIRKYANSFKYSPFMKVMNTFAPVRPPISKTNLLTKDPHYRACIVLWDFIESYNKAGYKIEIEESAPSLARELVDDFDAINMIQYIALKKKMGDFDPRRRAMETCDKRVVKPSIEEYESTKEESISKDIGGGSFTQGYIRRKNSDDEELIRDVLLRALRKEAVRRELEDKELLEREAKMSEVLNAAMQLQDKQNQERLEHQKELARTIRGAIKEENERAKQRARDENTNAQPAMRALRKQLNRIENSQDAQDAAAKQELKQNDDLMRAVLGDLLRIEEERDFIRTNPCVVKGHEKMPVPVPQAQLPATRAISIFYTKMFTPPVRVAPQDWQAIKDERKDRRTRHSEEAIEKALINALHLENNRARRQQFAQAKTQAAAIAEQQASELSDMLAQIESQAQVEKLLEAGSQAQTEQLLKSPNINRQDNASLQVNEPMQEELSNNSNKKELGFWQKIIKNISSWWEDKN